MKGITAILSFVLLLAIVITSVGLVIVFSQSVLESAVTTADIKNAETILKAIDNALRDVVRGGVDSASVVSFVAPKSFKTIDEEDAVQFETTAGGFDYLSRTTKGNVIFIAGSDVSCEKKDDDNDGDMDLVAENSFVKGVFTFVNRTTPMQAIDTLSNIIRLTEKTGNTTVTPVNSSFVLDDIASTSAGVGYSEILRSGNNLPLCDVHFFIDSAVDYDIFYRLYAGADFFVVEVRNIR